MALKAFEEAAEKVGFYVEYISKKDYARIPEFDALFIRTTTSVNDYTYAFSRYAYAEGLVVMDDPWSILRCANKIYLYETLRNANILMPKTVVLNKKSQKLGLTIDKMTYPMVLKLPDSAFSKGVYKVSSASECRHRLDDMFKVSELIIAQAYMPSDYDWRIGVLDGELLYACKYFMVRDHWQIVKWQEASDHVQEGDYEAIPVGEVPEVVAQTALRACKLIGDGLYGVDIKYMDKKAYVIEINDNPSIEYGVEDGVIASDLYLKIMHSFYNRLEKNTKVLRSIN